MIAEQLTELDRQTPLVKLGSYPRMGESPSLIITLESTSEEALYAVKALLEDTFHLHLHQNRDN